MREKEEIKRIDGKYFLIRELETNGDPIDVDGQMMQPIQSIDNYDCQHCYLYYKTHCDEICPGGFFVRVLPENSKEKDEENHCAGKDLESKEKTTVEWEIGEIKQIDGEWYQCVKGGDCADCAFVDYCKSHSKEEKDSAIGLCVSFDRSDGKHVVFQKLEKVEEPYKYNGKIYQLYELPMRVEQPVPYLEEVIFVKPDIVQIEIKQTKEDNEDSDN